MYHFRGAEPFCGLYRAFEARPSDVNVLCVAVLRQELQEGVDVQVVIIINVTEPPATNSAQGYKNALCVCLCVCGFITSVCYCYLLSTRVNKCVILQSHLTGEGFTVVSRRTVGVDQVSS